MKKVLLILLILFFYNIFSAPSSITFTNNTGMNLIVYWLTDLSGPIYFYGQAMPHIGKANLTSSSNPQALVVPSAATRFKIQPLNRSDIRRICRTFSSQGHASLNGKNTFTINNGTCTPEGPMEEPGFLELLIQ